MKIDYKRFAFFGASLTRQKVSYADRLMLMLGDKEYKKFGYGSMHIEDAGICFLDEVISYNPDICFVDWFSTGNTQTTEKTRMSLDCILYKILSNNIKPVFLLFPRKDMNDSRTKLYKFVIDYCDTYNVSIINVYELFIKKYRLESNEILRDYVHTTETGSQYYAEEISKCLFNDVFNLPDFPLDSKYNLVYPPRN
ncbi:MAG: hypothetical protein EB127_27795, partial [Alphaproteobacteria bacterium]|nr:hypothetical protein [Alphaproteobacteria bacterium]